MKKWERFTPAERSYNVPTQAAGDRDPLNAGRPPHLISGTGGSEKGKLVRGFQTSFLYGTNERTAVPTSRSSGVAVAKVGDVLLELQEKVPVGPSDKDFEFWQSETLDPKTGRTTDSKILHNIGGEDRGICRDALVGRICQRGAECPFLHPVRGVSRGYEKDVCCNMLSLSSRSPLNMGDCAVVKILDVISPYLFSLFVLDYSDDIKDLDLFERGSKPHEPVGFWELVHQMEDFYGSSNQSSEHSLSMSYRTLEAITDVFIAVEWQFIGKKRWLRGIALDICGESDGSRCLKANLLDIGKHVSIRDVACVRRLDNRFLTESWFACRAGLAGISLPPVSSSSRSTLAWFRKLFTGKLAWIKVVDEEFDMPLVQVSTQIEDQSGRDLADYLIEELIAFARAVPAPEEGVQALDCSDDEESLMEIIPG